MNALADPAIALRALRVNKLRSALTMLGIIIGVGAVIAMVRSAPAPQARVQEQIQSLGRNLIIVLPGSVTPGGVRLGLGRAAHAHRGRRRAPSPREMPGGRGGGALGARQRAGGLRQPQLGHRVQGVTPTTSSVRD